jgi:hypothetical protein
MVVRYYSRMRLQRVYPLSVEVSPSAEGAVDSGAPVTVRPLITGALVVPPERKLDTGRPGARADFHVTALAKGRLRGALVEIHQPGQVVQTIPLQMKGTTQVLTWLLALLTILVPLGLGLLVWYPMTGDVQHRAYGKKPDPGQNQQQQDNQQPQRGQEQGKRAEPDPNDDREVVPVPKLDDGEARVQADAAALLLVLLQPDPGQRGQPGRGAQGGFPGDARGGFGNQGGMPDMRGGMPGDMRGGMPGMRGGMPGDMRGGMRGDMRGGMAGGADQPSRAPGDEDEVDTKAEAGAAEEVFRDRVRLWVRARLPNDPPDFCDALASKSCGRKLYKDSNGEEGDFVGWLAWGYKWVRTLTADGWWFYTGMVFLGMTVGSWILHTGARGTRRQVVMLTSRPAGNTAETLPLSEGDEPPTLEPVD